LTSGIPKTSAALFTTSAKKKKKKKKNKSQTTKKKGGGKENELALHSVRVEIGNFFASHVFQVNVGKVRVNLSFSFLKTKRRNKNRNLFFCSLHGRLFQRLHVRHSCSGLKKNDFKKRSVPQKRKKPSN
jgi:hypothetical protein